MVDETLSDEQPRAPRGHREPERPLDDNPYIKLDGPAGRLFSDFELEPLASVLGQSLANEVVNGYINEALRALPDHWIRKAGVYLPELGRRFGIWPSGRRARSSSRRPTAAGRMAGCSISSAALGRSIDSSRYTTFRRPESGWCSRRTIRRYGRRCLASQARVGSG